MGRLLTNSKTVQAAKVKSSNIAAIGCTADKLFVEYLSGGVYAYDTGERTAKVYGKLLSAQSKGTYMDTDVKPRYTFRRLSPAEVKVWRRVPTIASTLIKIQGGGKQDDTPRQGELTKVNSVPPAHLKVTSSLHLALLRTKKIMGVNTSNIAYCLWQGSGSPDTKYEGPNPPQSLRVYREAVKLMFAVSHDGKTFDGKNIDAAITAAKGLKQ